MDKETCQFI